MSVEWICCPKQIICEPTPPTKTLPAHGKPQGTHSSPASKSRVTSCDILQAGYWSSWWNSRHCGKQMTVLGRESVGDIAGSRLADKASLPYWRFQLGCRQAPWGRWFIPASGTGYSRCCPERRLFSVLHSHTQKEQEMEEGRPGAFRRPTSLYDCRAVFLTKTKKRCSKKEKTRRWLYRSTTGRKCALNILKGWVIFAIVGRVFTDTAMVCHHVRAGVRRSLCLQEQNHLLWVRPHDPREAQNWVLPCQHHTLHSKDNRLNCSVKNAERPLENDKKTLPVRNFPFRKASAIFSPP